MSLRLCLLRHAKSSWKDTGVSDLERGLKPRGRRAARAMGAALGQLLPVTQIDCSPARRAQLTLAGLLQAWPGLDELDHSVVDDLYTFDRDLVIEWLRQIPEQQRDCVLIGHNPAFTELVNWCCGNLVVDNLPTAGCCVLQLDIENWAAIKHGCGTLDFQLFPRHLDGDQAT